MNFRELQNIGQQQGAEQAAEQDFHFGSNFSMAPTTADFKFQSSFDHSFDLDPTQKISTISTSSQFNFDSDYHKLPEHFSDTPTNETEDRSRSSSPAVPSAQPSKKTKGAQVVILSPSSQEQVPNTSSLDTSPTNTKVFPDEQTYLNYLKRRQNNNAAASKSRQKKRQLEIATLERAKILEEENAYLKVELQKLQVETRSLKEVLQTLLAKAGFKD